MLLYRYGAPRPDTPHTSTAPHKGAFLAARVGPEPASAKRPAGGASMVVIRAAACSLTRGFSLEATATAVVVGMVHRVLSRVEQQG